MSVNVRKVDFRRSDEAKLVIELLDIYASDPMGGGHHLSQFCRDNLISELLKRPFAHAFLAFIDEKPCGLSICFEGFSTFECKPLINIHDMVVIKDYRRHGVCSELLFAIQRFAEEIQSCKITLEVLEGNFPAYQAYVSAGFQPYVLDENFGSARFMQKLLAAYSS